MHDNRPCALSAHAWIHLWTLPCSCCVQARLLAIIHLFDQGGILTLLVSTQLANLVHQSADCLVPSWQVH